MTKKRFLSEDNCCGYYTEIIDNEKELDLSLPNPKKNLTIEELVDLLNSLNDENEQLKKGMIEVVDRYIKNVECNPPSSIRTYGKIKGALINIREGLRDLIEDLE